MAKRRRITVRQMLDRYERKVIGDDETEADRALQRTAFLCGVAIALGEVSRGVVVDLSDMDDVLSESVVDLPIEADSVRTLAASDN